MRKTIMLITRKASILTIGVDSYSTNRLMKMKPTRYISLMLMTTVVITIMTVALISSSLVSSIDVFAAKKSPRDICKINQDMCNCSNDIEILSAHCCTFDAKGEAHCETCDIDVKTGN